MSGPKLSETNYILGKENEPDPKDQEIIIIYNKKFPFKISNNLQSKVQKTSWLLTFVLVFISHMKKDLHEA